MGRSLWDDFSWVYDDAGTFVLPPEALATILVFMVFIVTVQFLRGASSSRMRGSIVLAGVVTAVSFLDTFLSNSRGMVGFEVMVSALGLLIIVFYFVYLRDENARDYLGMGLEVKDGIRNKNVGE